MLQLLLTLHEVLCPNICAQVSPLCPPEWSNFYFFKMTELFYFQYFSQNKKIKITSIIEINTPVVFNLRSNRPLTRNLILHHFLLEKSSAKLLPSSHNWEMIILRSDRHAYRGDVGENFAETTDLISLCTASSQFCIWRDWSVGDSVKLLFVLFVGIFFIHFGTQQGGFANFYAHEIV